MLSDRTFKFIHSLNVIKPQSHKKEISSYDFINAWSLSCPVACSHRVLQGVFLRHFCPWLWRTKSVDKPLWVVRKRNYMCVGSSKNFIFCCIYPLETVPCPHFRHFVVRLCGPHGSTVHLFTPCCPFTWLTLVSERWQQWFPICAEGQRRIERERAVGSGSTQLTHHSNSSCPNYPICDQLIATSCYTSVRKDIVLIACV